MEPNRVRYERVPRSSNTVPGEQTARRSAAAHGESRLGRYAYELVMFARMWLPYCGAPVEEIFEQFVMTNRRFREALWFSVRHSGAGLK